MMNINTAPVGYDISGAEPGFEPPTCSVMSHRNGKWGCIFNAYLTVSLNDTAAAGFIRFTSIRPTQYSFVVKPEGGQQCISMYFWLNQWGSMKTNDIRILIFPCILIYLCKVNTLYYTLLLFCLNKMLFFWHVVEIVWFIMKKNMCT